MSNPTNILQTKCDSAFQGVLESIGHQAPVTLIAFYNNGHSEGTAIASSLSLDQMIATLEARMVRWCGGKAPLHEASPWMPTAEQASRLADYVRQQMPFSVAFALLIGAGPDHAYASFIPKESMLKFFHEIVLPKMKAQQVVAPQPEAG